MQNREVESFPKQNYLVTASVAVSAGDMAALALASGATRYGRIVDDIALNATGMMSCRGVFECNKVTTADTWNDRAKLEAVVDGTTKLITIQALDTGICIGRSIGATIGTDTFAKIELIPELN